MNFLKSIGIVVASTFLASVPFASVYAEYPNSKPISIVVPFSPGGGLDTAARTIADQMARETGANFVIENRAGAGGLIGMGHVARAKPDGYTMAIGSPGNISVAPSMNSQLPYHPEKDLAPISMAVGMPLLLVTHADAPFSTVSELLDYAKNNPGKLTYGSGGTGTSSHLAGELFVSMTDIDVVHVPYKGASPLYIDLIAGRLDYSIIDTSAIPHIDSGKLRLLGVTTSTRSALLPDAPTIDADGIPGYEVTNWYGFFVPAGTPDVVIHFLNSSIAKAVANPSVVQKLNSHLMEIAPRGTPEEFAMFIRRDTEKWGALAEQLGLQPH